MREKKREMLSAKTFYASPPTESKPVDSQNMDPQTSLLPHVTLAPPTSQLVFTTLKTDLQALLWTHHLHKPNINKLQ